VKLSFRLTFLFAATSLVQLATAATIGPIDTFQSGTTEGWFAGGGPLGGIPPTPPHVVANGGPAGAGDQYLVITADAPSGAGSRVVALNASQWAGNYLSSGITGIALDLKNLGATDLTIRLLFEDPIPGPPANEAVTTLGAFLPVGSDWTHFVFPISPSSLTTIFGDANVLLSHTTVLRIIDSPTPTEAVQMMGVLGVDNIEAVPEPGTFLIAGVALAGFALWRRRGLRV
jgi:hypothetical protein